MVNGAKMGQTVRQTMPFNAHYAFVQAGKSARYGQQTRPLPTKPPHTQAQSGCGQLVTLGWPGCCIDEIARTP
jgi:hypothetical protein